MIGAALAACVLAACSGGDGPEATIAERDGRPFVRDVRGRTARVWAVGDVDVNAHGRRIAALIANGAPDRVLYLGDVYDDGTAEEFRAWGRLWRALAKRTAPTPGNHEWPNAETGYLPYWRRTLGRPPVSAYALRAGGWEILSVNSEASVKRGSRQERWLRRRVAARRGTCRIAFWHLPRFSAGRHGDQRKVDPLWQAVKGRARIVLSGHDHDTQRFKPRDGLTQFVVGAGGRELYEVDRDPRLAFADDERFAALRLDLRPGRARFAIVAEDGATLDRGTIRCRPLTRS